MKTTTSLTTIALALFSISCFAAGPGDLTVFGEIESKTGFRFPDGTLQTTAAGGEYFGVVVVAKNGGNFTSIQAAIDSITAASNTTPYLVWVAPGIYAERVVLKPWVSLRGAGREATLIRESAVDGATLLEISEDSEVSAIGIECRTDGDSTCIALKVAPGARSDSQTPLVQDVAITAFALAGGTAIGLDVGDGTATEQSRIRLVNSEVTAGNGLYNIGVRTNASSYVDISNSRIDSFSVATGVHVNRAIQMGGLSVRVSESRLSTTGGTSCAGLFATIGSIELYHSEIEASSTASSGGCTGIEVGDNTNLSVNWSDIVIEDGYMQYGLRIGAGGTGNAVDVSVSHSRIRAADYTFYDRFNVSSDFQFTHFDGGGVSGGSLTVCRYSTDENLNVFAATCP